MLADGHQSSKRRFVTARVIRRAVAFSEMTFKQVLKKTDIRKTYRQPTSKSIKVTAFELIILRGEQ